MSFRITGLDPAPFAPLFALSDADLHARGARRVIAERSPGYPDRIALRDALPGERLLLLNHVHQPADTPFRAAHAIYVLEHATERYDRIDEIPEVLRTRTLSLRAFDGAGMLVEAALCEGDGLAARIEQLLTRPDVAYLHLHYAAYGCYACRVDRADAGTSLAA